MTYIKKLNRNIDEAEFGCEARRDSALDDAISTSQSTTENKKKAQLIFRRRRIVPPK